MPRPAYSEKENDTIRRDLLEGALKLFRKVGADELSLRRLAVHLDISHTKMYRYFHSKEDLLVAIRLRILDDLFLSLKELDPVKASPTVRLRTASEALRVYASTHRDDYVFLFFDEAESSLSSREYLDQRNKVFNHVVAIAEAANKAGETKLDGRTLANLAWATLHGLFMLNFRGQLLQGRSFDELFENALDLLFGPVPKKRSGSGSHR